MSGHRTPPAPRPSRIAASHAREHTHEHTQRTWDQTPEFTQITHSSHEHSLSQARGRPRGEVESGPDRGRGPSDVHVGRPQAHAQAQAANHASRLRARTVLYTAIGEWDRSCATLCFARRRYSSSGLPSVSLSADSIGELSVLEQNRPRVARKDAAVTPAPSVQLPTVDPKAMKKQARAARAAQ